MIVVHYGMSLREALKVAVRYGCTIRTDSGARLIHYPGVPMIRVNARRKDAPGQLVRFLWGFFEQRAA